MPPQSPAHRKILAAFAKALRKHRDALGLGQSDVAKKVGISAKTLCNIEASNNFPSLPVYAALCRVLNLGQPPLL